MSTTPVVASPRISWDDVPRHVRAAVEAGLGAAITSAVTQDGGFSPGAAVRVVCEDGRRAFVKAVGLSLNPDSPGLHRAELHAMSLLPADVPAPALLASFDDGDWVALVLEDVDGRRPGLPWTSDDAATMAATLEQVATTRAPDMLRPFAEPCSFSTAGTRSRRIPLASTAPCSTGCPRCSWRRRWPARSASATRWCTGTPARTMC